MVYGRYNELVNGVYKPTNITGGHHPAPSCTIDIVFFSQEAAERHPSAAPQPCAAAPEPLRTVRVHVPRVRRRQRRATRGAAARATGRGPGVWSGWHRHLGKFMGYPLVNIQKAIENGDL